MKILMVLTSHDQLGNTGQKTEAQKQLSQTMKLSDMKSIAAGIMFLLSFIVRRNDPRAGGELAVG